MQDLSVLLDMRSYTNWSHKISSWKYLTIWRHVLPVFPEHRVPHVCSPPWAPSQGCCKSAPAAAQDLILVEAEGKCQVPNGKCQFGADTTNARLKKSWYTPHSQSISQNSKTETNVKSFPTPPSLTSGSAVPPLPLSNTGPFLQP